MLRARQIIYWVVEAGGSITKVKAGPLADVHDTNIVCYACGRRAWVSCVLCLCFYNQNSGFQHQIQNVDHFSFVPIFACYRKYVPYWHKFVQIKALRG
jgi:hypothetical protein